MNYDKLINSVGVETIQKHTDDRMGQKPRLYNKTHTRDTEVVTDSYG